MAQVQAPRPVSVKSMTPRSEPPADVSAGPRKTRDLDPHSLGPVAESTGP